MKIPTKRQLENTKIHTVQENQHLVTDQNAEGTHRQGRLVLRGPFEQEEAPPVPEKEGHVSG